MSATAGKESPSATAVGANQSESNLLREWKARKEKLHAAQQALRDLPGSEYEHIIREMIRVAPTAWHLKKLVLEIVRWLKWLSKGHGDHWRNIPENNDNVIASAHYELARIAKEFNVSLTTKSTPLWLRLAKSTHHFKRHGNYIKEQKASISTMNGIVV